MTPLVLLIAFIASGGATAVVELDCSDNATCINHIAKDLVKNLRQQKAVKLFDLMTIEPLGRRQGRASRGLLTRFLESHAYSFDWNDFTFKISQARDGSDTLELEVFESRTAKDVTDVASKKSSSKSEEQSGEEKVQKLGLKRRQKKKVMQVLIPLLFGMKSAGAVIFAFTLVAVLTIKAFVASKMALLITVGMAMKKLYESYSSGVDLPNQPFIYSQYPIDFPSATSHAYSVNGVSPQFASPEMYNPTALGSHTHPHDILPNDASAQQSQQAPIMQLMNGTRAAERWDGKSKLMKLIEPVVNGFRNILNPIANVVYGAIPATFRGLSTDISTTKSYEDEKAGELDIIKPKEILVAQPRFIAQRKTNSRKNRPKKHSELKVSLNRLKHNKDLTDYVKTKKYKYNYPHTYYYPRMKYIVNPSYFSSKPNNSRLVPYNRANVDTNFTIVTNETEWKPIIVYNQTATRRKGNQIRRKNFRYKRITKKRNRTKRSIENGPNSQHSYIRPHKYNNGYLDTASDIGFSELIFGLNSLVNKSMKSSEPAYYTLAYKMLMITLDLIQGFFEIEEAISDHLLGPEKVITKTKKKKATYHINKTGAEN